MEQSRGTDRDLTEVEKRANVIRLAFDDDPARLDVRATIWLSGGRIRWRTIQLVLDAGYADAFRARHPDDAGLTLPTGRPQVRLDSAFVPASSVDRVRRCEVVRTPHAAIASDHFPLLAEFDV